jgi:glutathione peroxidase
MKIFGTVTAAVATAALALSGIGAAVAVEQDAKAAEKWKNVSFFTLKTKSLAGEPVDLAKFDGKVVLVVNVASKCGFTSQYAGLEKLFKELESKGLVVIGFPSNDFGGQEPGSAEEIRAFCTKNYGVTFPMMEKVRTKAGEGQSEIYQYLGSRTGSLPSWNFGKYLVGRDGAPIAYFSSKVAPDAKELREAIEKALAAKPATSAPDAPKAAAPTAGSSPR